MILIHTTAFGCSKNKSFIEVYVPPVNDLQQFRQQLDQKMLYEKLRKQYTDPDVKIDPPKLTEEQMIMKRSTPFACVTCNWDIGQDPNLR